MNNYCCACGAYLKAPSTTFHYFQTSYFTITFYYPFYPPPTFPFLPSLQKQRTLPNSRRGGGLPRPLPRFSPLSQTPPTPPSPPTPHYPLPRTTPIQNPPPTAVTTIIHFSFFIIHHSLSSPPTPPFPPSPPLTIPQSQRQKTRFFSTRL